MRVAGGRSRWSLAAVLLCHSVLWFAAVGCFSSRDYDDDRRIVLAPEPPPLLTGSAAILLTNVPPFGANCRIESPARKGEEPRVIEGQMLSRGTQLLFDANPRRKKLRGTEMTFVWDTAQHTGYAASDALQGYAPIRPSSPPATVSSNPVARDAEKIDGHLCRAEEATVRTSDGLESRYTVWRAEDLRGFPMRIKSESGAPQFVITFSDVRFETPAARLFEVPSDFAKYDSPRAMIDELFRREAVGRPGQKAPRVVSEDEMPEGQRQFRR